MDSRLTNVRTKSALNISGVPRKLNTTKRTAGGVGAIRAALTLAVLLALLLFAARPAQAQTEMVAGSKVPRPTETVLYSFTGGSDSALPEGRLTSDGAGNFYGTTDGGGPGYAGYGTVFELSPNGSGGWNKNVLYSFTGGSDGALPACSPVIFDSLGNLYGTTAQGGAFGGGVVFELSPVGAGWTETVLHSFANTPDGALPFTGLIMDPAGNLYGTTYLGGSYNNGTVFELSPSGGDWTEKVIYDIGSNGAGLTMDAAGNIFGVTNLSTVFELSANGNGGWNPIALYTFGCTRNGKFPKGACPQGTPVLDKSGNIYGTTTTGGAKGCGTVYELSPGAKGKWTEKVLHSFNNNGKDGYDPWAGIVFDAAGNIYGTTLQGGGWNAGTVFELVAPVGDRIHYTEKVLWNFNGTDGSEPYGRLVLDSAGNLYGTTIYGGPYFPGEYGVVFELTP